jgi:hypothetical protein
MVSQKSISVGDNVCFVFGTTPIQGVVVDDRGPIGADHVRIYAVRIPNEPFDDYVIEMPGDELDLAVASTDPIPEANVVDYLEHGGLVQILKSNSADGANRPQVWLVRDSLGNVVHTFHAEHGLVGGAVAPFFALHGNRIFTPKQQEVIDFLESFGLSVENAERVVRTVGTAP